MDPTRKWVPQSVTQSSRVRTLHRIGSSNSPIGVWILKKRRDPLSDPVLHNILFPFFILWSLSVSLSSFSLRLFLPPPTPSVVHSAVIRQFRARVSSRLIPSSKFELVSPPILSASHSGTHFGSEFCSICLLCYWVGSFRGKELREAKISSIWARFLFFYSGCRLLGMIGPRFLVWIPVIAQRDGLSLFSRQH